MNNKGILYNEYKFEDFILDGSFVNFATNKNEFDIKKWEKRLSQNPENKEIALKAKKLISQLRFKKQELSVDLINEEWQKLSNRLLLNKKTFSVKRKTVFRREMWKYAAAASIILVFLSTIYFLLDKPKSDKIIAYNDIFVPKGEIKRVFLPDSTLVFINSDSKFSYAKNFGEKIREVFLEGEAWFDVTHNAKMPFIVHAPENDITVLGTAFNVFAYPNENIFRTSLERGKVSVSHNNKEAVELKVNQTYFLLKNSQQSKICETEDIQSYSSWKEGKTAFKNQPFSVILRKLERSHNVVFVIQNQRVADCKYTGAFSIGDDINSILEVIKLPTAFEYEIVNDSVIIK